MNHVARTTLDAMAAQGVAGLSIYQRALASAFERHAPVFGRKAYADLYRRSARDPEWVALSLYIVSAMFGLFQGGIVPSYATIVRKYFPPREAGVRTGIVLMDTLFGMALGGWVSGAIFDWTGSYRAAFLNGIGWNLLNLTIAFWLLRRSLSHTSAVTQAAPSPRPMR